MRKPVSNSKRKAKSIPNPNQLTLNLTVQNISNCDKVLAKGHNIEHLKLLHRDDELSMIARELLAECKGIRILLYQIITHISK